MKKRILALLVAMSMMTSLAACGAIDDEKYDEFIPLISTDSDINTDSQTTTDSASGDDSSVPEQTEDPAVTTTANSEEPSSSDTNATDNSSQTNSQSETTTTTTQGENSGSVTTTPASGSSTTTTTTTAKNPTSSATTTTTKKPTSSTTTTTTKKPTSSTTTTTTKKPTSSTTTTTTAHKHSYTSKITKNATCLVAGEKTYTCSCGHSYTEGISATGHSYTSKVVSPTPEAQGYTLYTCSKCSSSYKDDYTAKITLSAPSSISYPSRVVTEAAISWSKVSNADGYILSVSNGSDERSFTVPGTNALTYTVKSLTPGTMYYFKVKSYKTINGTRYESDGTKTGSCATQLADLKITSTASDSTMTAITLKWNKVTGAGGYEIQQYKNSAWTTIKTISSGSTLSHTVSGLNNGTTYKFRIRAFSSNKYSYSLWTEKSISTLPPFSTITSSSSTSNSITLSWASLGVKADGYVVELYKGTSKLKTVTLTGTNTTNCTFNSLSSKTTYKVVVYGYRDVSGVRYQKGQTGTTTLTTK
ncbi:MAG: fibronectin type III domain-containing protein [Oscillospiraceae bacterium]|nr:fibronectin type III domain-containing protein [Oscillospiraceae bacterium]